MVFRWYDRLLKQRKVPPRSNSADGRAPRKQPFRPIVELLESRELLSAGGLDPTFDGDGMRTDSYSSGTDHIYAVLVQPDGKILVGGDTSAGQGTNYVLTRYNSDGTPDAGFGDQGRWIDNFGPEFNRVRDIALQPDGKIVVAADISGGTNDMAVARLTSDGFPDDQFGGGDGEVVLDFPGANVRSFAIAVQSDGRILAAGSGGSSFAIARLDSDGNFDTSFGTGGRKTTSFNVAAEARKVFVLPDGKILVVGDLGNADIAMVRYNSNGAEDSSFGDNGKRQLGFGNTNNQEVSAVLQSDGRIVVQGTKTDRHAMLARFNRDGNLDPSFGTNGVVDYPVGITASPVLHGLAVQFNDDLIVAGRANKNFVLARFKPNGTPDDTFGPDGNGIVTADFSDPGNNLDDEPWALAVQPNDGKIVAAGYSFRGSSSTGNDFAVARFLGDPINREDEPNDQLINATPFATPTTTLLGNITNLHDVDVFAADLAQGDTLKVRVPNNDDDGHTAYGPTMEVLNSAGQVLASSLDGHTISCTVGSAGTYYLRLTANNSFSFFTGAYQIEASVTPFTGVTESENNNTTAAANPLGGTTNFRGSLDSGADGDYWSFTGTVGQAIAVKFADLPRANPSVRLFSPTGVLIASDRTGVGLAATLTKTGAYFLKLQTDNATGSVQGPYVAQLLLANQPKLENVSADSFTNAAIVSLGPFVIPQSYLFTDASQKTQGLKGSYVNSNLRGVSSQADWRTTQTIAGKRVDPVIDFPQTSWGSRSQVGLGNGSDSNWDDFSVQWDGYVKIAANGTRLSLSSDDGARLWIDINHNGVFSSSGAELLGNNWGNGQGTTLSKPSVSLAAGLYKIRIQYEEGGGDNTVGLFWTDAAHSAGAVAQNNTHHAIGVLANLNDVDVFAFDLSATGFYEFSLVSPAGALATQGRLLTLYNQFGQGLEYSTAGRIATDRYHYRPEYTGRYYLTVAATEPTGLGGYDLATTIYREFPQYRDLPLFYQDYGTYNRPAQVPSFLAFFESMYDPYQIDLTQNDPGGSTEHVDWRFVNNAPGSGSGGAAGGGYGNRRVSGGGSGGTDASWNRLADAWYGLFTHENGHGVGLPHSRHPLSTMAYGDQVDYFPIGSYTRMAGDPWFPTPKLQNERSYLDWVLEAGRLINEGENNDTLSSAQQLDAYFAQMGADADPRNDQVVITGNIATRMDADLFRFHVGAGETFALDIDSAEFQYPLDGRLELLNSTGALLASNSGGMDRDTGLTSVDPYLTYRFTQSGDYFARVTSEHGTAGFYRLKVTPQRAFDSDGPRVVAAWPDGGATVDSTTQITFWINDQLDPATLTAGNFQVVGQATGVHAGSASFDPIVSTLTWHAVSPLPPDTYTVTLHSGGGGITDLRGNQLDGETDGSLNWPEISGDGNAGGDFVTAFQVSSTDTTPAAVDSATFERHPHNRAMFTLSFDDELDIDSVYRANCVLRGPGPDHTFETADDTFTPIDILADRIHNTAQPRIYVYTRGGVDPDTYRIEATFLDASGNTVNLAQVVAAPADVPDGFLFTDAQLANSGLVGSYVNQSLRGNSANEDWRQTQTIAGTRVDPVVTFPINSFGDRAQVGITGGSDADWNDFSAQWDGYINVPADGVRLFTRSDDGSRMWIDVNHDGVFEDNATELVDNHWGNGQGTTTGPASAALPADVYQIRIQYEEGDGDNRMMLLWDYSGAASSIGGRTNGLSVADVSQQPGTVVTSLPTSIDVTFSAAVDPASLTRDNFRVRYSPDPVFFDVNDIYLNEADGSIAYDAAYRRASFQPAVPLAVGFFMIELNGQPGGIHSVGGQLLDGEFLDSNIAGYQPQSGWQDSSSGDGNPGGDYRASFRVEVPVALATFAEGTTNPPSVKVSNLLGTSISDPDAGALKGAALVGLTGSGTWQYLLSNGATWQKLGAVSASAARLLGDTDKVRFVPALNFEGNATIVFHAWDRTNGSPGGVADLTQGTGGATAFSVNANTGFVVVTPVSDAPVVTAAGRLTPILPGTAQPAGNKVADILGASASDPDAGTVIGMAIIGITGSPANGTWQFSLNGGLSWNNLGTVAATSALLLRDADFVRFVAVAGFVGKPTLTYRAWDQSAGVAGSWTSILSTGGASPFSKNTQTTTLTVNTAPTLSPGSPTLGTFAEDTPNLSGFSVTTLLGGGVSDPDVGALRGAAILATTGAGTWQYSINGGTWTKLGAVSPGAARLLKSTDRIRFLPAANRYGGATIDFHAWDQTSGSPGDTADLMHATGNATPFSVASDSALVTINPVNDAPVLALSGTRSTPVLPDADDPAGDIVADILGSSASDPDAGTHIGMAIIGMSGAPTQGTWQQSLDGGTTWDDIGAVSPKLALLLDDSDMIRFVPAIGFLGKVTLTFHAWDQSTGTAGTLAPIIAVGGSTAFSKTRQTASLLVNTAPTLTASNPSLGSFVEDAPKPPSSAVSSLLGTGFSDPDAGARRGAAIVGTTGGGAWQFSINGGVWTKLGTVSLSAARLMKPTDRVRFVPAANFNGDATINFHAWDQTTGSPGGTANLTLGTDDATSFSGDSDTAVVTVNPVNDAPILTGGGRLTPILPGDTQSPGDTVAGILGSSVRDADAGTLLGLAVIGAGGNASQGVWQFSLGGGNTWNDMHTVAANSALLLRDSDRVRFVPAAGFVGKVTLTYRAWDQTAGVAGTFVTISENAGAGLFSSTAKSASLVVNSAPELSPP